MESLDRNAKPFAFTGLTLQCKVKKNLLILNNGDFKMRKITIVSMILFIGFSINSYSANETKREGICGTRIAQPGPDPQCEESTETCYVKIYYDDGTTGETRWAVWEPATQTGFGDIKGVDVWSSPTGQYFYKILLHPYTDIFYAPTEQIVHNWVANQP